MATIDIRCQLTDIDLVYRIGKQKPGDRAHPILVSFKMKAVHDNIYFRRAKQRGKYDWRLVYVNVDVNESTRKKREGLKAV